LVLLCQLVPENLNVFFKKVGTAKVKDYFFDYNSFKHDRKIVAFLHSFTGCDTTSGFAGKGKKTAIKSLISNENLSTLAQVFNDPNTNPEIIAKNGCDLIAWMYGEKKKSYL